MKQQLNGRKLDLNNHQQEYILTYNNLKTKPMSNTTDIRNLSIGNKFTDEEREKINDYLMNGDGIGWRCFFYCKEHNITANQLIEGYENYQKHL